MKVITIVERGLQGPPGPPGPQGPIGIGMDTDWYEGDGFITSSNNVQITGSLNVTGSVNLNSPIIVSSSNNTMGFDVEDIFIIKNSNDTLLKIKNSGLLVLKSFETEPTAEEGAIYYNSSSFEFFLGTGQ